MKKGSRTRMHKSSMLRMKWFIDNYIHQKGNAKVLDVGSYSVNGNYKELMNTKIVEYVGLDIEEGPNVDVVVDEIYNWNSIEDENFDFIISGQAFEHIEYPWKTMGEIYKKIKKDGIICIIAPNSLWEHRYPKDCYRYFSDGMRAMAESAGFSVIDISVAGIPCIDASEEWDDPSNDVCLIAKKGEVMDEDNYPKMIMERRYEPVNNLMMHYDFLAEWYNLDNKGTMLENYIKQCGCKDIYIYGNEHVAKCLYSVMKNETDIVTKVIETRGILSTGKGNGAVDVFVPGIAPIKSSDMEYTDNTLIILTIFDSNRCFAKCVERKYPGSKVVYLYDIVSYGILNDNMRNYSELYIYGAGKYGQIVYERINMLGFDVTGFVVSDSHKNSDAYIGMPVYSLSEVSVDAIIVTAMRDDTVAINNLKNGGYTKYIDGKQLICAWKYTKSK